MYYISHTLFRSAEIKFIGIGRGMGWIKLLYPFSCKIFIIFSHYKYTPWILIYSLFFDSYFNFNCQLYRLIKSGICYNFELCQRYKYLRNRSDNELILISNNAKIFNSLKCWLSFNLRHIHINCNQSCNHCCYHFLSYLKRIYHLTWTITRIPLHWINNKNNKIISKCWIKCVTSHKVV